MTRNAQRPVRTEDKSPIGDTLETHPAYGIIGASRVSGNAVLFGSDFRHQNYMTIRVQPATLRRGLSNDWVHGGRIPYVEVALSEAQWATFVSTPNVGEGVPCTVEYLDSRIPDVGGQVPGIEPDQSRREQFSNEFDEHLKEARDAIDRVLASASLRKADRADLERARQQLGSNAQYVVDQFDEHMEKTVEKAKTEVNAYLTSAIHRAGIKALGGDTPLLELAEPEGGTNE